jgi:hypothetical protein
MNIEHVRLADVERELTNGLHEGQSLDVADRAADLGDDHINVVGDELLHRGLDLVGDVRNDLDRSAEVFPLALLLDDAEVNLAGGVVAIPTQGGVGEALVVAEVEVGLGAVVEDVDLAVLIRAHGAGIDVDVGVELLQADAEAALFEQHADRGTGQPLAQ